MEAWSEFQKSGVTYALQDLTSHKEEGSSLLAQRVFKKCAHFAKSKSTAFFFFFSLETNQGSETTLHRVKPCPEHLQGSQLVSCLVSAVSGTPSASDFGLRA